MTGTPDVTDDAPLVLVIDDEPAVRTVIGRLLSKQGYRVLLAASGREGITLFEQNAAAIRLVVLDWHLPGTHDFQLRRVGKRACRCSGRRLIRQQLNRIPGES